MVVICRQDFLSFGAQKKRPRQIGRDVFLLLANRAYFA